MDEFLEDEGKLGHGFTSVDALEEVDIGDGDRPRPMFISAKLDPEYKQELVKLLKECKDCFAWEYFEMLIFPCINHDEKYMHRYTDVGMFKCKGA